MEDVNIYIATDIRGAARVKHAKGMYILECFVQDKPYTKEGRMCMDDATDNALTLTLLAKAVSRMQKRSVIRIFTRNGHILSTIKNEWNTGWQNNGWKNAKGQPVKNAELWQAVTEELDKHIYTVTDEKHSYENWLSTELKFGNFEREEKLCGKNTENLTPRRS